MTFAATNDQSNPSLPAARGTILLFRTPESSAYEGRGEATTKARIYSWSKAVKSRRYGRAYWSGDEHIYEIDIRRLRKAPRAGRNRVWARPGGTPDRAIPTFLRNRIRDRMARQLAKFVADHRLGEITVEMDFRLGPETVRDPDVAFVTNQHLDPISTAFSYADLKTLFSV